MRGLVGAGWVAFAALAVAPVARAAAAAPSAAAPSAAAPPAPAAVVVAPPPAPSQVHVDVGLGTYFPLALDVDAVVELPYRILVQGSLGWMPSPYSNTIIDVIGDFGALNGFEQDLIKDALQSSFVVRLSAGWRPFPTHGLELLVGYALLTAGGSVSDSDVVDSFLQSKGSSDRVSGMAGTGVPLSATLQNFDATIDWRFLLWDDRIVLRPSIGYIQCVASSTSVTATPTRPAFQAALSKANADLQGYLNPYFTEYVKAPVLGLHAYYRF